MAAFIDFNAARTKSNTALANIKNFRSQAAKVTFGAYRLPESLFNSIGGEITLEVKLSEEAIGELN